MCEIGAVKLDETIVRSYPQASVLVCFDIVCFPIWNVVRLQAIGRKYTKVVSVQRIVARHPYTSVIIGPNLLDVGIGTNWVDVINGCAFFAVESI